MHCFEDDPCLDMLDRGTFSFQHKLMGHPALSLENLANVLPALPPGCVMHSKGLLRNGDDFETVLRGDGPRKRPTIEETIESIRISNAYVMVRGPQADPSFAPLFRELISDVEQIMRRCGVGNVALDPQLFLFIASPNSVTPFHIDRASSFLMQFRGSKEVSIFPQWDERIVRAQDREAYVAYANTQLPWDPALDGQARKFDFRPGQTVHIPFTAGHHVRNGSEDVSISMSVFFSTRETLAWKSALSFNHAARPMLRHVGMTPSPVGMQPWRDAAKAGLWDTASKIKKAIRARAAAAA